MKESERVFLARQKVKQGIDYVEAYKEVEILEKAEKTFNKLRHKNKILKKKLNKKQIPKSKLIKGLR